MKALTAVLLLATFSMTAVYARPFEGLTTPSGASPAGSTPSTSAAASQSSETLFQKTLPLDIDTATYYELLAWVRRLGLSERGTRSELQQRLRDYYKISAPSPSAPSKNQRIITVTSAHSAKYFTMEKVKQKYIRLSGGVDLKMYDPKTDTTHDIIADTIVFNETEKTITATGHIEYLLTGKQKSEVFRGKSLTFNVDNWNGIFFQGVSESKKTIDKQSLTFSYTGQTIHRLSNDVVTLDNGIITSSSAIPPNYKITASRIWVLAPGEWALSNAVLYLGRIPIFYFPFFFHPGDNLLFHPSVGYREEEGYYLQTTTYLLGRRPKTNSSLSFLQVAEDTNVTYNTKVRGLFLRKTTPVTADEQSKSPYDFQKSYVKILFDIYSRLGIFGGIDSKIVNLGILKNLQATLSVARSRDIFLLNGTYTPFLQQSDGSFTSLWNSSSLFGLPVPFRYGMDLELNATNSLFSLTASVPFYSDPTYYADFLSNRAESIDWSKLLGLSGSATSSTTTTQQTIQNQTMTSLLWSLHSTFTPTVTGLNPYVTQASITAADLSMFWQSKQRSLTGVEGLDPALPNYITGGLNSTTKSDFYFPDSQFFYPQSWVLPSVSAKIAGTIFQTTSSSTGTSTTPASGGSSSSAPSTAGSTSSTSGSTTPPAGSSTAASEQPGGTSSTAGSQPAGSTQPAQTAGSAPPSQGGTGATQPSTSQTTSGGQTAAAASPPAAGGGAGAASTPAGSATGAKTAPGAAPAPSVAITPRPPWQEPAKQKQAEAAKQQLRVSETQPDVTVTAPAVLSNYTQSLTYSITPTASIEDWTVNDGWLTPSDINLGNAYSIFNARGTGALTYNGALLDKLLTIQDATSLSGNYKIHYNKVSSVTQWDSFLLQDYNATFLTATNALTLTTYPFQGNDLLMGTNLQYSLAGNLFTRSWVAGSTGPVFQDSFFSWDSGHVTTHTLAATLALNPWNQSQNLSATITLPPLVPQVVAKAVSQVGPLTTTATDTFSRPQGSPVWVFQPLTLEGTLAPLPWILADQQFIYDFNGPGWTTSTSKLSLSNAAKTLGASETFTYDLQHGYPTDSLSTLQLGIFNLQYEAKRTPTYQFAIPAGWTTTGNEAFVPSNLAMGINYKYTSPYLWKNRIQFGTSINTAWNLNLLQFTDNALTLDLTGTLSIYKFLDISLSLKSEDRATYRYFPAYAQQLGQTTINPFVDFLKSINIFSTADRTESNFKMQSIDLKVVHHLEDWDLVMELTGSPQLETSSSGVNYYQWNPTFTLSVNWKPVPEIKSNITDQNGTISF